MAGTKQVRAAKPTIWKDVHTESINKLAGIKNSERKSGLRNALIKDKKKEQRKQRKHRNELREKLGEEEVPKEVPKTIDDLREANDDAIPEDLGSDVDGELAVDEYTDHRAGATPKVFVTTSMHPKGRAVLRFIEDLLTVIPNSEYIKRRGHKVAEMCEMVEAKGATDLVMIHVDRSVPTGMLICHLPTGPTAWFKLDNITLRKRIKNHGWPTQHAPEVLPQNFTTRLGRRVSQVLAGLWSAQPEVEGRQAVTVSNKRDFMFLRFHRYVFNGPEDVGIQELGPRFTLKLRYLQTGPFDPIGGEFEWNSEQLADSKRKFFL